ncbi:hypothetical protein VTN00DRAFT_2935 [Thermoascus crustaceus]|uniref:uncharacterized protein n=1 Tax=Thermoascus crustaceus TaxID=5088 RepID=UPI0037448290
MPLDLNLPSSTPTPIPPLPPTATILSTAFLGLGALHFLAPLQMCKIFGLPCSSIERVSRDFKPKPETETEPAVPTTATVEPPPEGVEGKEQCRDCQCRCQRQRQCAEPEREPEPAPLAFIYANGGREVMLAIAFLGMGMMGDRGREGMRALMLGIAVAAQIDAYVVWKYGGDKYGGWKGRWPMHSIGGVLVGLAAWRGWGL